MSCLNRRASTGHWLGLVLEGPSSNPFAIGAQAEIEVAGRRQRREVRSGGSFQSQGDLRLHFGLGDHAGALTVEIRWPDGHRQRESTDGLDRYWTIRYRAQ
jgi:hypothetical protein